jgi:hypothetical protein
MGMYASRSCLTLVNRVMRETGLPEVAAFSSVNSKVALESLNDAVTDVWQRNRWTFQRLTVSLPVVANQQDYTLNADFDRMAAPFRVGSTLGLAFLTELTPEQWWASNLGASAVGGSPTHFTIDLGVARFSPIPDSNFVTINPNFQYQYFKANPIRRTTTDTASSWDLPLDFENAMVNYGKARLKKFLEYPDWQSDMQDYETALQTLKNKWREVRIAPQMQTDEIPMTW